MAVALTTCSRGEVATQARKILSVSPGDGTSSLAHTQVSCRQAASMARLISPKRSRNVNELQDAVIQWEITLVEHESKFSEFLADSVKTAA